MKLNNYFILIFFSFLFSEDFECHNDLDQTAREVESCNSNIEILDPIIVGIKPHIIFPESEEFDISINQIENKILEGISWFSQNNTDINFYISPVWDSIYSDYYYNCNECFEPESCDVNDLDQDALWCENPTDWIDVYFVDNIIDTIYINGEQEIRNWGGKAKLPIPSKAFVIKYSASDKTFAHELGHCLGLHHTHYNYDYLDSDEERGEYVIRPDDEFIDDCEVNCHTNGDAICDTEADPYLSNKVNNNCEYFENETDCCGEVFTPPISNLMSYAPKTCKFDFTSDQINRMKNCIFDSTQISSVIINPDTLSTAELHVNCRERYTNEIIDCDYSISGPVNAQNYFYNLTYQINMDEFTINNDGDELKHIYWNSYFHLNEKYFDITLNENQNYVTAFFDKQYPLYVENEENYSLKFKDPWYIDYESENYPNQFYEIESETIYLFRETPIHTSPVYNIKTNLIYYNQQLYLFNLWSGNGIIIINPSSNNTEINLDFFPFNLNISPGYINLNEWNENNYTIPNGEYSRINIDYNLIIPENFEFFVNGNLEIYSDSIGIDTIFFNNQSKFIIEDLGQLTLKNIVIINNSLNPIFEIRDRDLRGLYSLKIERSLLINSQSSSGILYSNCINCSGFALKVENSNLINFDIEVANQSNEKFHLKNNIINNSNIQPINILNSDYFCYNNTYNSSVNFYTHCYNDSLNPPQFVNSLEGDFNLQSTSLCIDAGNPNSPLDPDGTRADIGVYYFNQCTTMGDADCDDIISINDILIIVEHILGLGQLQFPQSENADINNDGLINVTDILEIIYILIEGNLTYSNSELTYLSGTIESIENGERYKYSIDMLNEQDVYILHFKLQFNNKIPLNVEKGSRSNDMTVTHVYKEDDYTLNIMVYSPEGRKIPSGYGTILEIELESTALGRDGELTDGSEFIVTDLANNPESLIPIEIVSADELSRLADEKLYQLIPYKFALHPVYPNPFNPTTTIKYDVPEESHISIKVFDLSGRIIESLVNTNQSPGIYSLEWNAEHLPSGAYFVKFETKKFTHTQKVILIK